jgi:hypothetical protein
MGARWSGQMGQNVLESDLGEIVVAVFFSVILFSGSFKNGFQW